MLYPWYVFVLLGGALTTLFTAMICAHSAWRRNCLSLLSVGVMFASMVVIMKSTITSVRFFSVGYLGIKGVPLEMEFFGLGVLVAFIPCAMYILASVGKKRAV